MRASSASASSWRIAKQDLLRIPDPGVADLFDRPGSPPRAKRMAAHRCGGIGRSTDTGTRTRAVRHGAARHRNLRVRSRESVPAYVVLPMSRRATVPQHGKAPPEIGRIGQRAPSGGARRRQSSEAEGHIDVRDGYVPPLARFAHGVGPGAGALPEREPAWPRVRLGGRPVSGSVGHSAAVRGAHGRAHSGPDRRAHCRTDARPDPCADPRPDSCSDPRPDSCSDPRPDRCSHR